MKTQQDDDGFFRHHPGITALAISAFLKHPENKYQEANHAFIRNAMSGLVKLQQATFVLALTLVQLTQQTRPSVLKLNQQFQSTIKLIVSA